MAEQQIKLSKEDEQRIKEYQEEWQRANAAGDKDAMLRAQAGAAAIRNANGYYTNADGTGYYELPGGRDLSSLYPPATKNSPNSFTPDPVNYEYTGQSSSSNGRPANAAPGYTPQDSYFDDELRANNPQAAAMLDEIQKQWQEAYARGDQQAMDAAHNAAQMIRAQNGYVATNSDGTGFQSLNKPTNKNTGGSSGNAGSGSYSQYTSSSSTNAFDEAEKKAKEYLESLKAAQSGEVNRMFDKQNQNAYIQREMQMLNLPLLLGVNGQSGGMSETTKARIGLNYGNQVNANEQSRISSLNNINMASDQQALQMAIDFADKKIAQDNWNRQFDWNVFTDNRNFNRGVYENDRQWQLDQDSINKNYQLGMNSGNLNQQEMDWNKQNDTYAQDWNRALTTGNFSVMKKHGWTDEEIKAAEEKAKKNLL